MKCPDCNGHREGMVHLNRGDQPHEWRMMPCRTCQGSGSIDEDHANRIGEGERLKAERLARGMGLRQEAARLGISPVELSDRENGRTPTTKGA